MISRVADHSSANESYMVKDKVDFRKEIYFYDVFLMKQQQHQGEFWH